MKLMYHYLIDAEGINIFCQSCRQLNVAGSFKLSILFYLIRDLANININK